MALTRTHRAHGISTAAPSDARPEVVTREMRVEELRRLVAKGDYKADPQRLALRILCRALGVYSPENRT
jgi:anti-sigma28 factor (negative regulator of flagellin synthesis)